MRRKLGWMFSNFIVVLVLSIVIEISHAHQCEHMKDYDDHTAVFLSAENTRPLPLVQVIERHDPVSKVPLKTKIFSEDDCEVKNHRYNCCAIFRISGMDIREKVCVDFASRNLSSIWAANGTVEEFNTTLRVGPTHAAMTHLITMKADAGNVLQNVTIPLCIPFLPLFSVCVTIRNTTYDFNTKAIRSCFSLDVSLQALPGFTLFSLDLQCLKYVNKTIVKDPTIGYDVNFNNTEISNISDNSSSISISRDPSGGLQYPPINTLPISSPDVEAPDPYTGNNMAPTFLNRESSSGEATTKRNVAASPQARINWSPRRIQKRDIPKAPEKRAYLPERNKLRNRVQNTRQFVNLYNFDKNWHQQFFI